MKKLAAVIGLIIITVIGVISYPELTAYFNQGIFNQISTSKSKTSKFSSQTKDSISGNEFNFLVVGADVRYQQQERADVLMVVSFDLKTKRVGILSIPRDTRVKLPGYDGYHKINAAYSYGGLQLTEQVIEEQLGVSIDHHLQLDYREFTKLVDKVGGIEVAIANDLNYVDRAADLTINLEAGRQVLTGRQALKYLRFRGKIKGDIGRIERQQKFLRAVLDQLVDLKTIVKFPNLIKQAISTVQTDIKTGEAIKLGKNFMDLNLDQLKMETLPGKPKYINGISYWIPNPKASKAIINSLIKTKTYFQHQTISLSVLNGAGTSDLASKVATILDKHGYKIDKVGNADHFSYRQNYVVASDQQIEEAVGLVGLIRGKLRIIGGGQKQITLIIGQDNWS